ncbi:MAG: hypothetical protein ACKVSF_06355 [Alphaproteobacteria bacterium]
MCPRLGGELPAGADGAPTAPWALPADVLAFSHGRAALSWLHQERGPFRSALHAAYTCPSMPEHLDRLGIARDAFDLGCTEAAVIEAARALPGPVLVLVPALFGAAPWLDAAAIARALGAHGAVLVDAAQTAFGALDIPCPPNGFVLSCPRKALAISDGALLRTDQMRDGERDSVARLPEAREAAALKFQARALFASGREADEDEALRANKAAEATLPAAPHRMSDSARAALARIDADRHRARRRANAATLADALRGRIACALPPGGVPFHFPLLIANRDEVLRRMQRRRLFATALWPDARLDPARHPRAARHARELLALPIDQRHDTADIAALANLVRACL